MLILIFPVCGDDKCEMEEGEDCSVCPKDCGTCPLKAWQIALIVTTAVLIIIGVLILIGVSIHIHLNTHHYRHTHTHWSEYSWTS